MTSPPQQPTTTRHWAMALRHTSQGGNPEAPRSAPLGYVRSHQAPPLHQNLLTSLPTSNIKPAYLGRFSLGLCSLKARSPRLLSYARALLLKGSKPWGGEGVSTHQPRLSRTDYPTRLRHIEVTYLDKFALDFFINTAARGTLPPVNFPLKENLLRGKCLSAS